MLYVLHVIQIIEVLLYIEALHVTTSFPGSSLLLRGKSLGTRLCMSKHCILKQIVWIFLKNKRPFRETYGLSRDLCIRSFARSMYGRDLDLVSVCLSDVCRNPGGIITTHFTDMCTPHFFSASERRSTVDVRRRPGYKIWRFFKFEFSEVNINQYK